MKNPPGRLLDIAGAPVDTSPSHWHANHYRKGYRSYVCPRVRHLIQCAGVKCLRTRHTAGADLKKQVWVPLWALVAVEWLSFQSGIEIWRQGMFKTRRWPKGFWKCCIVDLRRLNEDRDALYAFLAELVLRFGGDLYLGRPAKFALEEGLP